MSGKRSTAAMLATYSNILGIRVDTNPTDPVSDDSVSQSGTENSPS